MRTLFLLIAAIMTTFAHAQKAKVVGQPIGFATCTSLTDATPYAVTGGGNGKAITLKSDGKDMRERIIDAITNYDVIIFDGSKGDFMVSSAMLLDNMRNKSIIGINNARISTERKITYVLHQKLDSAKVLSLSTNAKEKGPFFLSNGHKVGEECEAAVRQMLIDYFNDPEENFRESGLFKFTKAENIVLQNLTLIGPGAIDVGGADLLTLSNHCRHIWVDHIDFIDGMDGNFDINGFSDLITVSWCRFSYTDNTYQHANTNLIGSNDNADWNGEDNLNVTFAYCIWDHGCNQRMPMVRFGKIHLLNCLYDCPGSALCVNPRKDSEVLIEGCYFSRNVLNPFRENGALAYEFRDNVFREGMTYESKGTVTMPYQYKTVPAYEVAEMLRKQK